MPLRAALAKHVFPSLVGRPAVRVWVPACSTGQDAYAIAMTAIEELGDKVALKVLATDENESALRIARAGVYAKSGISRSRLRRFFVEEDGEVRIKPHVRAMCNFAPLDLANDIPYTNIDLVFARNVELSPRTLTAFQVALRHTGFLVLGRDATTFFSAVDAEHGIYASRPKRALTDWLEQSSAKRARATAALERRRLATSLHDGVAQTLALLQNKLAAARDSADPREAIRECAALVEDALEETRAVTVDLSPPIVEQGGLAPALRWLAGQFERRHGVRVDVSGVRDVAAGPELAAVVYRSIRELLTNVAKHSGVPRAAVTLERHGDRLIASVRDRGVGFEKASRRDDAFGLFSIREQLDGVCGSMSVHATRKHGTCVVVSVPAA